VMCRRYTELHYPPRSPIRPTPVRPGRRHLGACSASPRRRGACWKHPGAGPCATRSALRGPKQAWGGAGGSGGIASTAPCRRRHCSYCGSLALAKAPKASLNVHEGPCIGHVACPPGLRFLALPRAVSPLQLREKARTGSPRVSLTSAE
jgi:hypothetical protein